MKKVRELLNRPYHQMTIGEALAFTAVAAVVGVIASAATQESLYRIHKAMS